MKKLHSILMLLPTIMLIALAFISCGGDDDNEETGGSSSNDYIEITLNGKTYRDNIKLWSYVQIDPVGKDAEGNPLTATYDMEDHFEKYGFSFLFGIVHYSKINDLLASKPGTYHCTKDLFEDDYYSNLTFWSKLTIDYNEYEWVEGTHKVNSIKEVNGHVQIEGTFTSTFWSGIESSNVEGRYRVTIP